MTWETARAAVLHRDGKCMNCGAVWGLDPHHIKSRGSGGTDDMINLISLCRVCHNAVGQGYLVVGSRMSRSKARKKWKRIISGEAMRNHLRGLIGVFE